MLLQYFNSCNDIKKVRILFFFVVVITFLCFIPTLFNDLLMTWDDNRGIVNNVQIRQLSLETLRWAFTTFYFEDWLPLIWISFALEYALWGLNPVGYHLTNNVIHALNAGLFFWISLTLLKRYISLNAQSLLLRENRVYYCAMLAALLFATHPLRVESVAWAYELKDVLSLFFGMIALLFYLWYVQSQEAVGVVSAKLVSFLNAPFYWLAILFYALSLFSKAMLVSLPLIMLILDWFPLKRINRVNIGKVFLEKTPFMLFAGITATILLDVHTLSKMPFTESNMLSRVLIAFKSITGYLLLIFWPVNLSPFHLHPGNIHHIGFEYLFPIVFFFVITLCCVLLINRLPVCMAVWLIYIITLIPVLGFTQVSSTAMADRYTYVPALAVSLLVALTITTLASKLSVSRIFSNTVILVTVFILSVSCYLTVRQILFWKDDVTLWSRAIDIQPHFSGRMYAERAAAFKQRGDFHKALLDISEAIAIATLKQRPKMEELYFERAYIFQQLGEIERATADYNYALSLMPVPK